MFVSVIEPDINIIKNSKIINTSVQGLIGS